MLIGRLFNCPAVRQYTDFERKIRKISFNYGKYVKYRLINRCKTKTSSYFSRMFNFLFNLRMHEMYWDLIIFLSYFCVNSVSWRRYTKMVHFFWKSIGYIILFENIAVASCNNFSMTWVQENLLVFRQQVVISQMTSYASIKSKNCSIEWIEYTTNYRTVWATCWLF